MHVMDGLSLTGLSPGPSSKRRGYAFYTPCAQPIFQ